jgi:Domain of unknown function (DUF4303)
MADIDVLAQAIANATRITFEELTRNFPGEFYYFVLATTGEAHAPSIAAWSREALDSAIANAADKSDAEWGLKWSYADSPFFCFGEDNFGEVKRLFAERPDTRFLAGELRKREIEFRINAMEQALKSLDEEGVFGRNPERNKILINVEINPPDDSNTNRAMRLNPPEACKDWLAEMAEPA